ncbi:hypothetical protein GCM10007964_60350 [Sphaerisporangium melleum]|uniref:Uncharacterized protein n=1 Tax=Sphaerisporangium melleum TaxID=321316 RepID=A0A917VSM1_9ACTN|nr:hypothetical protein GCM10007964_60350 [Sphaerisporangium melleum]
MTPNPWRMTDDVCSDSLGTRGILSIGGRRPGGPVRARRGNRSALMPIIRGNPFIPTPTAHPRNTPTPPATATFLALAPYIPRGVYDGHKWSYRANYRRSGMVIGAARRVRPCGEGRRSPANTLRGVEPRTRLG